MAAFTAGSSRVALCLHGMLGTWDAASSQLPNASSTSWRQQQFARFTHASIWQHVVRANREAGRSLDVYLHSWNPGLGPLLDELYQPRASLHEPVRTQLDKVGSQHLSLKRVLALVPRGIEGGYSGDADDGGLLIMVSRYDVLFFNDVLLDVASLAPIGASLWLPRACEPLHGSAARHSATINAACGCPLDRPACGTLEGPPDVGYLLGFSTALQLRPARWRFNLMTTDWWFVASRRVAASFGAIYERRNRYDAVLKRIKRGLPAWAHFFWSAHLHFFLPEGVAVRFLPQTKGLDFGLARFWAFGVDCLSRDVINASRIPAPYFPAASSARPTSKPLDGERVPSPLAEQCPGWSSGREMAVGSEARRVRCPYHTRACGQTASRNSSLRMGRVAKRYKRARPPLTRT